MKKFNLSAIGVSLFCLVAHVANASEAKSTKATLVAKSSHSVLPSMSLSRPPFTQDQINYIRTELLTKDTTAPSASFYGLLQFNTNLLDTQRTNVPDFSGQHVRLGTKVNSGKINAQIEAELLANNPQNNNQVVLRQAQINVDLLNSVYGENSYSTSLSLGAVRIGGAEFHTPDISNVPSQFSRQDGIYVQEKIGSGKQLAFAGGLGFFNTLFAVDPGQSHAGWDVPTPLTQPSAWQGNSLNGSLAYVLTFNSTYKLDDSRSVSLALYNGHQGRAPAAGTPSLATRQVNHFEGSLAYNDPKLFGTHGVISGNGVTFWTETEKADRSQIDSQDVPVDDSMTASIYGLSGAGDKHFDFMKKDDSLTYAASVNLATHKYANENPVLYNYEVTQIAGSVGYAMGTFEVALNAEMSTSDKKIYVDSESNTTESEVKSYVTAVYNF